MAPIRKDKLDDLEQRLVALGIRADDLEWSFVRARGAGGQKVNKTSSAAILKYLPTGKIYRSEKSRSQAENRFFAKRQLVEALELESEGKASKKEQAKAKKMRQKSRRKRRAKKKYEALDSAQLKSEE
ncbi:MAG: peptide chain release factor-like protein [Myxococcales bacterium]|nr:peptide chain release factor-like protein [Myxococcales bacterium]